MVKLGLFGSVKLDCTSFSYFMTQKLGTCRIYKEALTGTAAASVSCAFYYYPRMYLVSYDNALCVSF